MPDVTTEARPKGVKANKDLMKGEEDGRSIVMDGIRSEMNRKNEILTSLDA